MNNCDFCGKSGHEMLQCYKLDTRKLLNNPNLAVSTSQICAKNRHTGLLVGGKSDYGRKACIYSKVW